MQLHATDRQRQEEKMDMDTEALTSGGHSAAIEGVEQRYHVAGQGPLCVVHSGGPGVGWEYLRLPLVEQFMTLIYIEPIGTGTSGRLAEPRDYTLARYVRQVDGLLDHLGARPVHFLGHSYGGFVALRYALAHPERLASLILYDSSPTSGPEFWERVQAAVGVFAERHKDQPELPDVLAALRMIFTLLADPHATDEGLTSVFRRMIPVYFADYWARESEFAPLREAIRMYADPQRGVEPTPYDVRSQLGAIATRTLAMVGRYDAICAPYWSEMLAEKTPHAQLVVLEQSGHFGHIEEPEAFAHAISAFVR
jgi:proline iminopeptidase